MERPPGILSRAEAVLARLERQDALERERNVARQHRLRQITPDVGQFLYTLVTATRARSIVEIGTSGGYSTIWLAASARHTGAAIVTLEIDPAKVRLAMANLQEAGVEESVTIVQGDAFHYLRDRRAPADFIFLDAEKQDYLGLLELSVPLLAPGGLLVADNLISHAEELTRFRERALSDSRLAAVVVPIGRGELLAAKLS
jgi:predicted O-methyltransferase YrrM